MNKDQQQIDLPSLMNDENRFQRWRKVCGFYGLDDPETVKILSAYGLKTYLDNHVGRYEGLDLRDLLFFRDLAHLALIFRDGRGLSIQASLPDGEARERHTRIEIDSGDLLQYSVSQALNLLLDRSDLLALAGVGGKKDLSGLAYIQHMVGDPCRVQFREPFTSEELDSIIRHLDEAIGEKRLMAGRKEEGIPTLGAYVHGFIEAGGSVLSSMTPTQRYCLVGDLLMVSDAIRIDIQEWQVQSNQEKCHRVESWEASFLKTQERRK